MSNRAKWISIAAVVLGAALVGWAGRGALWHWFLALHGHSHGHGGP
jgi:membrane protein required for beta-lactamase induction